MRTTPPSSCADCTAESRHAEGRGRSREDHRQEEQAAAEEHGGKELVFEAAQALARRSDEPQEEDLGEED